VDDVSWRAERGQVVGLLGPNGAGKTTTLRMVMGLIAPDSGQVHVLGRRVGPGTPVLARVGALIEGPGFLPHLSGRANLEAYWAATGRDPAEAGYEEVLEIAALGGAVERPVRTYSHGMRQRLGIAQAMLGLPEVLVLDEPTNGLDPPQIAGLRPVLARYAAAGRTVVVSSHLLAEVELTCSHVVVMHAGRVVTTGTVAELVDSTDTTVVTLAPGSDPDVLADKLRGLEGITEVEAVADVDEPHVVVVADLARAEVVRAAAGSGADVVGVSSRRQLEEVFLGVIAAASGSDPDLRQVRSR
ncbi:MAG TPA: ATP-binding cassette domain-containing protein, partial [Acidobacteria bacterium]|nr:ATP-binding cassette domain-containing protein [Acidobacteriota bacterium]